MSECSGSLLTGHHSQSQLTSTSSMGWVDHSDITHTNCAKEQENMINRHYGNLNQQMINGLKS